MKTRRTSAALAARHNSYTFTSNAPSSSVQWRSTYSASLAVSLPGHHVVGCFLASEHEEDYFWVCKRDGRQQRIGVGMDLSRQDYTVSSII